jgi:hypothetical protein
MKKAWNAFSSSEPATPSNYYGSSRPSNSYGSPSRTPSRSYNDRSIITSICTRISIDVSDAILRHVKLDEFDRYLEDVESELNSCLSWEANLDQGPRNFRQDIAQTVLDRGVAAIVPVDTTVNPETQEIFDIYSLRVGTISDWFADRVKVDVWNEKLGKRQEIVLAKRNIGIVENPLYSVMNEQNSTFQRLSRKLTLLDAVDEQASSGKLDIIIQLPYVVKSEARQAQAEKRRTDIEMQLRGSQYGIAYIDGTEKVVQLNRPAENNLLKTIEYLTTMLYGQLGITEEVMNGTADEAAMLNYMNRTIKPIVDSIAEGMQRAFIGPVGKRKNERIMYFIDPFKLVAMKDIAEIGDKLMRNEAVTSNEIRGFIGLRPSADPKADELVNANMPQPGVNVNVGQNVNQEGNLANSALDEISSTLDSVFKDLGGEPSE